jgi:hypothetical protein
MKHGCLGVSDARDCRLFFADTQVCFDLKFKALGIDLYNLTHQPIIGDSTSKSNHSNNLVGDFQYGVRRSIRALCFISRMNRFIGFVVLTRTDLFVVHILAITTICCKI